MTGQAVLTGWDPAFSRYFAFSTLRTLGYRTRVSVSNTSDALGRRAEPVRLRLSAHGPDGARLLGGQDLGDLEPGRYWTLDDVDAALAKAGIDVETVDGEMLVIVHQTPHSHGDTPRDVPLAEVMAWAGLGDDYVEYADPAGGAGGGVFYQCPPLNDARIAAQHATVCQSPKVLFDDRVDAGLLVLNVSTGTTARAGTMDLSILDAAGERCGAGTITVPPFASRVVMLRPLLRDPAHRGNATLVAVSAGCTLVPFTFLRDRTSHALALDHTMPPANYHTAWADRERRFAWASDLAARVRGERL